MNKREARISTQKKKKGRNEAVGSTEGLKQQRRALERGG